MWFGFHQNLLFLSCQRSQKTEDRKEANDEKEAEEITTVQDKAIGLLQMLIITIFMDNSFKPFMKKQINAN